jgi:signal transduction histidine kinase
MDKKEIQVLLIEDNPGDVRLIREMLAESKLQLFSLAHSGSLSEGLDSLSNNTHDVVLLDIGLPDSSGLDSVLEIKTAAPVIPVIMLTGLDDEKTAVAALQLGVQDYLIKDRIDSNLLGRSIRYALERKQIEEELRRHREFLMELVEERTAELQKINEELEQEISERRKTENELIRSEQLASVGKLAAGVAHEINNPINGIINYAQMLLNTFAAESKEHDIAGRIIKESDRIAGIVKSLLSFARESKEEKKPVDISEILSDSLALTETQIRKGGINLEINIPPGLPHIIAQPQHIEQVFLNLISNACYALDRKYSEAHNDKLLRISAQTLKVQDNPHVRIIFYDHGAGIPAEIKGRIMDPFFTTKSGSEGTGLGLSISHGIIDDHGGRIRIDSIEGKFTKIMIDLPVETTKG